MRTVGAAFEFGVELAGGEPRVRWQFDDLDGAALRIFVEEEEEEAAP